MSLKHREDSITGIRLREAQKTKTAASAMLVDGSIILELMQDGGVCTGTTVKFKAPCGSSAVTGGIVIDGVTYTAVDALGNCITGKRGHWVANAKVSVIIDASAHKAYVTNAAGIARAGDRMIGELYAGEQTPGEYLVRNQKLSATEETPTVEGEICWQYE